MRLARFSTRRAAATLPNIGPAITGDQCEQSRARPSTLGLIDHDNRTEHDTVHDQKLEERDKKRLHEKSLPLLDDATALRHHDRLAPASRSFSHGPVDPPLAIDPRSLPY